jgi:hypothetical protein
MIAVYVSGHGYGHATRTAEVLRVVREKAPTLPITVATSAPPYLFEGVVAPPLTVRRLECDVGLEQRDALITDETATVARWKVFGANLDVLVNSEARWLKEEGVRLVLGDIPPSAFAAATAAKVRSVALGNFSWDWIYDHLARREPALDEAAATSRAAYAGATLLLRLPFSGDLSAFPRIEDIPLVARRPKVSRDVVRQRLELGEGPTVLLSFGGVGLPEMDLAAYGALSQYRFVLTGPSSGKPLPSNVRRLEGAELEGASLDYPELVGAVDVVLSKPGYGIVTDCIGARTRLVYTDRGDFPEYPILVEGMKDCLPAVFASNEDLHTGRIGGALEEVLAQPFPKTPDLSGAEHAAQKIVEMAEG